MTPSIAETNVIDLLIFLLDEVFNLFLNAFIGTFTSSFNEVIEMPLQSFLRIVLGSLRSLT